MHTKSTEKQLSLHTDAYVGASLVFKEAVLSGKMRGGKLTCRPGAPGVPASPF